MFDFFWMDQSFVWVKSFTHLSFAKFKFVFSALFFWINETLFLIRFITYVSFAYFQGCYFFFFFLNRLNFVSSNIFVNFQGSNFCLIFSEWIKLWFELDSSIIYHFLILNVIVLFYFFWKDVTFLRVRFGTYVSFANLQGCNFCFIFSE